MSSRSNLMLTDILLLRKQMLTVCSGEDSKESPIYARGCLAGMKEAKNNVIISRYIT